MARGAEQARRCQKLADEPPHARRIVVIDEGFGVTLFKLHPLAAHVGGIENKTDEFVGHRQIYSDELFTASSIKR